MYPKNPYNQNPYWQGDPYNQGGQSNGQNFYGGYIPQSQNFYNPYQNQSSQNSNNPYYTQPTQNQTPQSYQQPTKLSQQDLIAQHIELTRRNQKYRQVPIRTDEVDKNLKEMKDRFLGQNSQKLKLPTSPSSSIVPVNIYVQKRQPAKPLIAEIKPNIANDQNESHKHLANTQKVYPVDKKSLDEEILKSFSLQKRQSTEKLANSNQKIYQKDFTKSFNGTPFKKSKNYKPLKKKSKNRLVFASAVAIFLLSASIFGVSGFSYYQKFVSKPNAQVAGAMEVAVPELDRYEEYKTWVESKNEGVFDQPENDLDDDELTNYEEFLIGSNPISANSCNPDINDSKNLFNLTNPSNCQPIDLKDENQAKLFGSVLSISNSNQKFVENLLQEPAEQNSPTTPETVLGLFEVADYAEIDKITNESLDQKATQQNLKKDYLRLIQRTQEYINKYRSYETYDRNYQSPVHPAVYLEVSLKYKVPLKYALAIARTESRFGTDRYTNSGALTRPGQFQNIYSMGLTDGGSNLGFATWEAGVESFGKWYKKFQDRGVGDCNKWRIYNPNGDYCTKIENLAAEIDLFLK
jgi:hypothetical protein